MREGIARRHVVAAKRQAEPAHAISLGDIQRAAEDFGQIVFAGKAHAIAGAQVRWRHALDQRHAVREDADGEERTVR